MIDVTIESGPAPDPTLDTSWMAEAECKGMTSLFFTERGEDTANAKAVCMGCEVRIECLDYALAIGEKVGVWGGTSERERRTIRRQRSGRRLRPVTPIVHGTEWGYRRCVEETEGGACLPCRQGHAAAKRLREDRNRAEGGAA